MKISVAVLLLMTLTTIVFSDLVLINDPNFVKLTAVANPSHNLWWSTDYVLEIQALNQAMPVEVSYLIIDAGGTPSSPSSGIHIRGGNLIEGWDGTSFFQTEVGGWGSAEFRQNPKYLPLPRYRTCILMLARYEKIYFVVIRENDGQISYKILSGGPFKEVFLSGVASVKRVGSKFEVTSLGQPVEVGIWAKGNYMHDEVGGWASTAYSQRTKYYDIPHYGMFMMMVGRYKNIAIIIGNENDGMLGAITLYSTPGTTYFVQDLCALTISGINFDVTAESPDPVEITHFGFDNTCWQWEVNGWAKPEYRSSRQSFRLKHYTPSLIFVNRYSKAGLFFYNENDGMTGVIQVK
ncbi:MAG TPA: hypothetical protein PLP64_00720 [Pseudothermotoga sp.]|nr:hypothetical protein [Pseudothermotoga sp.]HOK82739.1 hypothetical protein [Pseudothermotoga sp.]HPP70823.1 hypothetical protein [Pseudothermotoga sp.]